MSLLKIPILLLAIWLFNLSSISHNPPPDKSERIHGLLYGCPTVFPTFLRLSGSIPFVAELAVIAAIHFPSTFSTEVLSRLVLSGQLPTTGVNRYFIAGAILVTIGGLGRLWCYRSLGRHFTYQLVIQKDHELVTTGPYAIVRHPSYLCAALVIYGMSFMIASPGSFMRQCGWLEMTFGRLIVGVWGAMHVSILVYSSVRCPKEDALLRERFREGWERYSVRVRYKLIPGVY